MVSRKLTTLDISKLITQTEAGKLRGVSRTTIHNYTKSRRLNSVKIGDKIFVYRSEVKTLKISRTVRTDEELLTDVRRVAKKLGHTPSSSDYKKHGKIHLSSVCLRFGNWGQVLARLSPTTSA